MIEFFFVFFLNPHKQFFFQNPHKVQTNVVSIILWTNIKQMRKCETYVNLCENVYETAVVIGWTAQRFENTQPLRAKRRAASRQLRAQRRYLSKRTRFEDLFHPSVSNWAWSDPKCIKKVVPFRFSSCAPNLQCRNDCWHNTSFNLSMLWQFPMLSSALHTKL